MLEELRLTSRIIRTQPAVLDMIPPRLTKLNLKLDHDDEGAEPVDQPAILHYLDRIAQQRQLTELFIHFDNGSKTSTICLMLFTSMISLNA